MLIVLNNLELEKSGMFKNNFQGLKASYDIGSSWCLKFYIFSIKQAI